MRTTRILLCVLLAAAMCSAGCIAFHPTELFARHSDPVAGWKDLGSAYVIGCPFGKVVGADYQDYIQSLPEEKRRSVNDSRIHFLESATGQRAVTILIDTSGTAWTHVLIYDQSDKRIKVTKYVSGHYMS